MRTNNIKIGVFGFGCVGQGLYNVLHQTKGIKAEIVKICVKNKEKQRAIGQSIFTYDKNDILLNKEIEVVVELIDDPVAAFEIVKTALQNGKAVVTANKKMVAENFNELYALQQKHNVPLLYEASTCASIPIIRNLEEYYDNDLLNGVEGIFNGSTNYILTKIFAENLTFEQALLEAQEKGFAETDPSLDIKAYDPKYKLCIILAHAFGLFVNPKEVFNYGIQNLNNFDIRYANEKGLKIKLVAFCKKIGEGIVAGVLPQFVDAENKLFNVENEYNGVLVESAFAENQFFVGKGAGSSPTGSAVLSDISALNYNYRYEYKKLNQNHDLKLKSSFSFKVYVRYDIEKPVEKWIFQNIYETYQSDSHGYIIGRVNFNDLIVSGIINRKDVNIISFGELKNELHQLVITDEETEYAWWKN